MLTFIFWAGLTAILLIWISAKDLRYITIPGLLIMAAVYKSNAVMLMVTAILLTIIYIVEEG